MTRPPNERGSISVVALAGALVLCLSALAAADVGSMLLARARAQAGADAAALAAAVRLTPLLGQGEDAEDAARATAERNGVALIRCTCDAGRSFAEVEVDTGVRLVLMTAWAGRRARASARAEIDPDVYSYR